MYKEGEVGATFGREHSTTLENFAHKCAPTTVEIKTAHEKTILQRQIDATVKQIDQLVYELYGLTEEEINIVESS